MSVAKGFRLSDDSTAKLDWNYVTKPDGTKSIIEEVNDVKADLAELEGGGVPTNVRQALDTILKTAVFNDTGLTDEFAIISSWASAVTAITLNQSSISISGATTSQLTATTTPSGGSVTWSSSDTSVATVSSNGLVTGVSNGTATITATSGDVSATCSVTVSGIATLSSISAVYTQTGTIYDTDDLDDILTAGTLVVTATYSDSSTATVANTDCTLSGTLTVGTSTITVSYGGKTTTFTVVVSDNWKTLIGDDLSAWYYYYNASYSGDVITIAPSKVSWDNYVKPLALYQYSAIKNKRIRISGTVELTGYSSGKGFSIIPGTFTAPSGTSTRKAYLSLDDTQASTTGWLTTSGTFTFDTESLTLADVLDTGTTPTDAEWVNAIIYLNANSGCVATVTDVTIEYLD